MRVSRDYSTGIQGIPNTGVLSHLSNFEIQLTTIYLPSVPILILLVLNMNQSIHCGKEVTPVVRRTQSQPQGEKTTLNRFYGSIPINPLVAWGGRTGAWYLEVSG
ncbi:hypothetical protein TNCV_475431 [Trichonephila clavipes]|nr:hypothetical protein TNCV_475431 [Trichonephila clavipes]